MQKKIDQLSGHTIICGFGRNGKQSMIKLQNYKKDFVIEIGRASCRERV